MGLWLSLTSLVGAVRQGEKRNRAASIWTGVAIGGGAIGAVLGGVLVSALSWRWVFFVNVPIGIALLGAAMTRLPNATLVDDVLAAARKRATALGGNFTIAVLDEGAAPMALFRMDGADLVTVGLALGKARTAVSNGRPSGVWRANVASDAYLGSTIPIAFDRILGGAVLFGGGYPFRVDGITVGGSSRSRRGAPGRTIRGP